jgi:hypothetical protein
MALTLKDMLVGALGSMATRGGMGGAVGRVGLAGMAATHAIPGNTGVTGQIGEFVRELGKLPSTLRDFNAALQAATTTLALGGGGRGSSILEKGGGLEKAITKIASLKEFAAASAAADAASGAAGATEIGVGEAAAGGGAVGAAGGPQGAAVGAALAIVALELAKFAVNLRDVGATLLESERTVGQYNGGITMALAQLDVGRIQRKIETAKDTEESVKALAKAQNRLEENLRPIDVAFTNIKNKLAAAAANLESDVLEGVFGQQKPRQAELSPLSQLAQDYAHGKYGGRQYPPIDRAHIRASNK